MMKKKHYYYLVLQLRRAKIKIHILSTASLMITKYNHTYSSKDEFSKLTKVLLSLTQEPNALRTALSAKQYVEVLHLWYYS